MADNERPVVFDITVVDSLYYSITTKDNRALGYGCHGLPSTKVLEVMQEMSIWMHEWVGVDVVFAFKVGGYDKDHIAVSN